VGGSALLAACAHNGSGVTPSAAMDDGAFGALLTDEEFARFAAAPRAVRRTRCLL
jgi:hypothetical protein